MNERPLLLEIRQATHGSFADNARYAQQFKSIFREADYTKFNHVHTEALDMIALKLSRILSGQAMHKDHWRDIVGYAQLAMEVCDDDGR